MLGLSEWVDGASLQRHVRARDTGGFYHGTPSLALVFFCDDVAWITFSFRYPLTVGTVNVNLAGRELVAIQNVLEKEGLLTTPANAFMLLASKGHFATFQVTNTG